MTTLEDGRGTEVSIEGFGPDSDRSRPRCAAVAAGLASTIESCAAKKGNADVGGLLQALARLRVLVAAEEGGAVARRRGRAGSRAAAGRGRQAGRPRGARAAGRAAGARTEPRTCGPVGRGAA